MTPYEINKRKRIRKKLEVITEYVIEKGYNRFVPKERLDKNITNPTPVVVYGVPTGQKGDPS